MIPHKLTIRSLRDLQADCSCGRWSMATPIADDAPDEALRERAKRAHRSHAYLWAMSDTNLRLGQMSRKDMRDCLWELSAAIRQPSGFTDSEILGVFEGWDLPRASLEEGEVPP